MIGLEIMITIDYEVVDYRPPKKDANSQALIKVRLISYHDDIKKLNIKFNNQSDNKVTSKRTKDNLETSIDLAKRMLNYHHHKLDNKRYKLVLNAVSTSRDPFYTLTIKGIGLGYSLRLPYQLESALRNEMYQYSWMTRNEVGFQIMLDIYEELLSRVKNDNY